MEKIYNVYDNRLDGLDAFVITDDGNDDDK